MDKKGFIEDGFIIDLENVKDISEIIYELSSILDMPETKNKKICLKLGNINLTQSQLLSIKSLINSTDAELAFIDTDSEKTELAALNLGIIVSELSNEIKVEETELKEPKIKDIEVGKPKDGLSYEIFEPEPAEKEKIEVIEKTEEELKAEEKLEELIDEENEHEIKKEESEQEIAKLPTLYLQQNLRSGQTMSYDGNIVLIGDTNPGSEIIAKGDITVWGVLGGIAHAGARGNNWAKIRALKMNAIQLRISGFYARRPDTMNIPFIQRSNEFTPEEARVSDKEIVIYKMSE